MPPIICAARRVLKNKRRDVNGVRGPAFFFTGKVGPIMETDHPLSTDEFTACLDALGPFEHSPRVAVAVSGGADSLALCLLTSEWARQRGGEVIGLTVDHRLRPESTDEAYRVGQWLERAGIAHVILPWSAPKPLHGLEEAARQARHALLRGWCAQNSILHLLLAHHLGDQAETVLLRLSHGSGVDGLAGMASILETPEVRILRPLLGIPRERLRMTLQVRGQEWIEDPWNADRRFARVRARALLAEGSFDATALAVTARRMGLIRHLLEEETARVSAQAVMIHPAGFAWLDPALWSAAPEEVGERLLGAVCRTLGGKFYPPRHESLCRLACDLRKGRLPRSFSGCLILPRGGRWLICRETGRIAPPVQVSGAEISWDGRFRLRLAGRGNGFIGALGSAGWRTIRSDVPECRLPLAVCPTLPALFDEHGVSVVPHLGYNHPNSQEMDLTVTQVTFAPACSLTSVGYCLV